MNKTLYLAYGSNLNYQQMAYRCPTAEPIAKDWLNGYKLVFQGNLFNAHANIIPDADSKVPVLIWNITAEDEKALDRYEGVAGGYYTKEYIDIELNGENVKALVYIMTPNPYGTPSFAYLNTIREGYAGCEFPTDVLYDAVNDSYDKAFKGFKRKGGMRDVNNS